MSTPLVSVLMTAYNREKYIAEAIQSVLASTFKDFELIIVDDGSKDRTVEIARRFLADPRVQIHLNEKNLGDYPNRNLAASLARGKYLKYVDSDDCLYPHGLGVMVDSMERFPQAALGLASPPDPKRPFPFQLLPKEAYLRDFFERSFLCRAPLSAIIKRAAFNSVSGFTGKRLVGDSELWHILAARFPVVLMAPGIGFDRTHDEQETAYFLSDPRYAFSYLVVEREQLMKPECPLPSSERDRAIRQVERRQARVILRAIHKSQLGYASEMFRQSGFTVIGVFKKAFAR